jgi:predicted phage tail protein
MGLKLTVVGEQGNQNYDFSQIDLPNFISTLFNHQKKLKDRKSLSVDDANKVIKKFEGSHEFRLDWVKNFHKGLPHRAHKRFLGLLVKGQWDDDVFTATQLRINKDDFSKGKISSKVRKKNKTKKDVKPFSEFLENLRAQNDELEQEEARKIALKEKPPEEVIASSSHEASSFHSEKEVDIVPGTPPLMVSSSEFSFSDSEQDVVKETPDLSLRKAGLHPVTPMSSVDEDLPTPEMEPRDTRSPSASPVVQSARSIHKAMASRAHLQAQILSSSRNSEVTEGEHSKHNAPVIASSVGTPELNSVKKNKMKQSEPTGWFSSLKWPAILSGLSYGVVRALDAAKLISVAAISSVSMMAAGAAFVVVGILQMVRESFKKSSYKAVTQDSEQKEDVEQSLNQLDDNQWQALRNGFDGQKSMLNQFKSSVRPNDYSNAQCYYTGYHLAEREPDFDLDALEQHRAKP